MRQGVTDRETVPAEGHSGEDAAGGPSPGFRGETRTRRFEGICIGRRGEGPDQTFKVRKVSFGVGVERIFPLYSPVIENIEVLRKGKVRRAKLNYLEGRSARESRIEERRADLDSINDVAEESDAAPPREEPDEAAPADASPSEADESAGATLEQGDAEASPEPESDAPPKADEKESTTSG